MNACVANLLPLLACCQFHLTADYCQMHRAETHIIPNGVARGWPTSIDFIHLKSRVEGLRDHLYGVMSRKVRSSFMDKAIDTWQTLGARKAQSVYYELGSFGIEQPG